MSETIDRCVEAVKAKLGWEKIEPRPSIAELERMLAKNIDGALSLEPDGYVYRRRKTTLREIVECVLAEAGKDKAPATDAAGVRGAEYSGIARDAITAATEGLVKEWRKGRSPDTPRQLGEEKPDRLALGDKMAAALTAKDAEIARLKRDNRALRQFLAHIHLHLTNDEDFGADEFENDLRKLDGGEWIDTESLLIDLRQKLEAAEARLADATLRFKGKVAVEPADLEALLEFFQDAVGLTPVKAPAHVKQRMAEYQRAIAQAVEQGEQK